MAIGGGGGDAARGGSLPQPAPAGQPGAAPGASLLGRARAWWRGRRARRDATHRLYGELVEQSRRPLFYAAWGVPDTREGRLEMVTLHAMLAMRRLRREGPAGRALAQELLDLLFADLDRHLREWGVGDVSVPRHMKKIVQSIYARLEALDPLLDAGEPAAFEPVLRRNVYGEAAGTEAGADPALVRRLASYLLEQERHLARQDRASLLEGRLAFGPAGDHPAPGKAADGAP